jgi:hypothetical protein
MRFRKLRIAWSVAWGIAALLLCVLWVRSYWAKQVIFLPNVKTEFTFYRGHLQTVTPQKSAKHTFVYHSTPITEATPHDLLLPNLFSISSVPSALGIKYLRGGNFVASEVPIVYLTITSLTIGCGSLLPVKAFKRFSLRTLLFAVTLIAVVLGAIIYAVR